MKNLFEEYSGVLTTVIVAIALIAICMGLKVVIGSSATDIVNNFNNKAQEVIDFDEGKDTPTIEGNYVGYYADIDNDGIVDGVIFFDYTQGADTTKGFLYNTSGVNVEPVTSGLASYELKTVDGKDNVVVKTSDGKDRFYVASLNDSEPKKIITTAGYSRYMSYWYKSAYSAKISNYNAITSTVFGSGMSNTQTMKSKWDKSAHGTKNDSDMFAIDIDDGWFIPSKDEWLVLNSNLYKAQSSYVKGGDEDYYTISFPSGAKVVLAYGYWTSSLKGENSAWCIQFNMEDFRALTGYPVNEGGHVRLVTTF